MRLCTMNCLWTLGSDTAPKFDSSLACRLEVLVESAGEMLLVCTSMTICCQALPFSIFAAMACCVVAFLWSALSVSRLRLCICAVVRNVWNILAFH